MCIWINNVVFLQTIEMIEKDQREAERRPITKITHKGEIEIESQEPVKTPEVLEVEVRHSSHHSLCSTLIIQNLHSCCSLLYYS